MLVHQSHHFVGVRHLRNPATRRFRYRIARAGVNHLPRRVVHGGHDPQGGVSATSVAMIADNHRAVGRCPAGDQQARARDGRQNGQTRRYQQQDQQRRKRRSSASALGSGAGQGAGLTERIELRYRQEIHDFAGARPRNRLGSRLCQSGVLTGEIGPLQCGHNGCLRLAQCSVQCERGMSTYDRCPKTGRWTSPLRTVGGAWCDDHKSPRHAHCTERPGSGRPANDVRLSTKARARACLQPACSALRVWE